MCLIMLLVFLGPRFGILVGWLTWPARWEAAFDTAIFPILGFLFFPWVTLAWLLVAPGGVEGFDYLWLGLCALLDVATFAGSGRSYRGRGQPAPAY